jgi:hypothetical protein
LGKCWFVYWWKRTRNRTFIVPCFGINSLKTKALRQPKNHSKKTDQGMILGTSAFVSIIIFEYQPNQELNLEERNFRLFFSYYKRIGEILPHR